MNDNDSSCTPILSASVAASAGSGKTWQLISRIIKLLISGVNPGSILAISFTRKAAAEMQVRLRERLQQLALCENNELKPLLSQLKCQSDEATLKRARSLYELVLYEENPIRITTFHAFCQDILQHFPLEADVPPGFELVQDNASLRSQTWEQLYQYANRNPNHPLTISLRSLFKLCNGIHNARESLNSFINHRSEWLSFTAQQSDPVQFAQTRLKNLLELDDHLDFENQLFSDLFVNELEEMCSYLAKHPGKKNNTYKNTIGFSIALYREDSTQAFEALWPAFFTLIGKPIARKESATQAKKMGEPGQQRFLQLNQIIVERLLNFQEKINRRTNFHRSCAWVHVGHHYLQNYDQIKQNRRLLDFHDLEWKTYQLLIHSDNSHWVQFKLDCRIDHILIDEYQDTNPTQWHLIVPLLQEMAASENQEKSRSAFIVGDSKQSIYRFRGAEPGLFEVARHWMSQHLKATTSSLDASWRSSPAIIDFVNWVFSSGRFNQLITEFNQHRTMLNDAYGRVEILPLISAIEDDTQSAHINAEEVGTTPRKLRNPLLEARSIEEDTRHLREGERVAHIIQNLIRNNTAILDKGRLRCINYSDILLLVRQRTHVSCYEKALQFAGIPYIGADKGTLLGMQEIQDMCALLDALIAPQNNLSLATALVSPIFSLSQSHLMRLAQADQGHWQERLYQLANSQPEDADLQRCIRLFTAWQSIIDKVPVHDLLDQIFHQGNIVQRYTNAYPQHLLPRLQSNLSQFLNLALDIDSGRYPSVAYFLQRLRTLATSSDDAPDEIPSHSNIEHVRILTIHAAKGLEAPAVFLMDSGGSNTTSDSYQALIDWPLDDERPKLFALNGSKRTQDQLTRSLLTHKASESEREETNLLYVALTRAKQFLYISACEPRNRNATNWYDTLLEQCAAHLKRDPDQLEYPLVFESGQLQYAKHSPPDQLSKQACKAQTPIASYLSQPSNYTNPLTLLAPSHEDRIFNDAAGKNLSDERALLRGLVIHRALQLLSEGERAEQISLRLQREWGDFDSAWLLEAQQLFTAPHLQHLFDHHCYHRAYNEVPIQHLNNSQLVVGVIDRLIVNEDHITILDYKTHRDDKVEKQSNLANHFSQQIRFYRDAAQNIWPKHSIVGLILFTHNQKLFNITDQLVVNDK